VAASITLSDIVFTSKILLTRNNGLSRYSKYDDSPNVMKRI